MGIDSLNSGLSGDKRMPDILVNKPWLAPLAGHTDLAYRVLCRELGASVACTEMVSAKGLVYAIKSGKPDNPTTDLLMTAPQVDFPSSPDADSPLVVQIFGDDGVFLAEAVEILKDYGFKWFDLNMGCSVPKVVKGGGGAALSRYTDAALKAAELYVNAVGSSCAAGVKFRLGWNLDEENYLDLAKGLEQMGIAWVTMHPRYARQGFSGSAKWEALAILKDSLSIPVIASGDLFTGVDAVKCVQETGVDSVMFARGALHNPAIFSDYLDSLKTDTEVSNKTPINMHIAQVDYLEKVIRRHIELGKSMEQLWKNKSQKRGLEDEKPRYLMKMRGSIPRYIKELPEARFLRSAISTCCDWNTLDEIVNGFFANKQGQ